MRKKPAFDQKKEVRKLARERVGIVKASRPIEPKDARKSRKHPQTPGYRTRVDEPTGSRLLYEPSAASSRYVYPFRPCS